jgi:hypothetical protein
LANSEVFEIEDEEHENLFGKGKKKRIIDRYFNPEGIEYLVYYVRKNTKLFDDKTFYDYKLCANFVDSQNQVLLDHQRHFRSKFINNALKIKVVFPIFIRYKCRIGQYRDDDR